MARSIGTRVQTMLVVLFFLGSLVVLLYNTFTAMALPQRELEARERLRDASRKMAKEAASIKASLQGKPGPQRDKENEKLRQVTNRILASYPDVEGGYFLALDDRFGGYAFPTTKHNASDLSRNEPPPLEAPVIRRQARQSLDSGNSLLRTEEVGPSRVVVFTEPVGDAWPAKLATWLMVRLTGPELLEEQLRRSEVSTYLALGGIGLSLLLTWNLGKTLKVQRRDQDRLREELRHAEYLAVLGKLLAGVAHEVRNPLAAIRSTVQLWQRLPDTAHTSESLDAVVRAVDRIGAIVSRLLFFSRADNAERRPVDLNQLLAETMDLFQAQATEQGVTLNRLFTDNLPPLSGSSNALRQVILNLVTNALQAMPQGGCLTCSTSDHPSSRQVEILVADTGAGVAEEDRRHLFEPFFTTRPDGTGLGLALCREIVNNHRGSIEYLTRENFGATFRILLPVGEGLHS